ncbi:MAG: hypothetical protein KC910_03305, partial [Candidatus Eremiobacteraeota bacterium]|nr:hypothetical protein [Candidatus Eremiobacteraeota bacterium]
MTNPITPSGLPAVRGPQNTRVKPQNQAPESSQLHEPLDQAAIGEIPALREAPQDRAAATTAETPQTRDLPSSEAS